MHWETLLTEQQFLELQQQSPLFAIFKHSTRCSVSAMAKNRVERNWNLSMPIYYLDLLQHRSISNLIATQTGIEHQSPQLIVFKNGKAIYNASHNAIDIEEIKEQLAV
ncbi:MAG: hypothetical protein RJA25_831 [Bacteroidota bacterium]|jgi:bacillithiol system protein YtxJ